MKKSIKGLVFFILFFTFVYCIQYFSNIRFEKDMDALKLNGKVVNKYIDKLDHNRPKLIISSKNDSITLDFTSESSGLFDFIQVGDSIQKFENTRDVRIINLNTDSIFVMSF